MYQISLEKLSTIVEQQRRKFGLSQDELGKLTDINRQMISRIEMRKYVPSLPQLNSLLKVLEISFEEIIEDKTREDIFMAMLGETKTEQEQKGFKRMISMMLCLRKHDRLRRSIYGE